MVEQWHVVGHFVSFRLVEHVGSSIAEWTSFYSTFKPLRAKTIAENTKSENSHGSMQSFTMVITADIRLWTLLT